MSDEPVEDGDSGSDAEGASSSSGSDDHDVDESADDSPAAADADNAPADVDDEPAAADADNAPADVDDEPADDATADEEPVAGEGTDEVGAPDLAPPEPGDGTGFGFVDDARETADDAIEADQNVASGNDSSGDADSDAADDAPETDPADHAPIGTQAPSPDEGPTTTVTEAAGAGAAGEGGGSGGSSILSGGIGGSAPPDDEEMPLTEHIEEMLTRLAIVVVIAALATLAAFPFANDVIIHMWYDVHDGSVAACRTAPQGGGCVAPHVYGPLELVLTRIRVAGLVGLLVALPLAVYQVYRFMRPGLYPHERRYYLAAVPFSLLLGIVGMTFAYFVLLPLLFEYFITYTQGSADLAFQLSETMNLILMMMGMLAIVFQIPLLIMLAIMMGITTRRWLERRRLYFWGLFLGVAVLFGPDPTGMAPFMLTATMVALFEGTLLLLRWTGR